MTVSTQYVTIKSRQKFQGYDPVLRYELNAILPELKNARRVVHIYITEAINLSSVECCDFFSPVLPFPISSSLQLGTVR